MAQQEKQKLPTTSGIYKIWFEGSPLNPSGEPKLYVGQGKNFRGRYRNHIYDLKRGTHWNSYLQNSFDKYGMDSIRFSIVEDCAIGLLNDREVYWIEELHTYVRDYGYNLTKGGEKPEFTEEHRKNISESAKKRGMSPQVQAAGKLARIGRKQPQEEIDRRAKSCTGLKRTIEQKRNMSESQKNRDYVPSDDTKEIARIKAYEHSRKVKYAELLNCSWDEVPELPPTQPFVKLEKKSGIYTVGFVGTDKVYIARANQMNLARRYLFQYLHKQNHKHAGLQAAYNEFKEYNLIFSVLEYCDKKYLQARKMHYINMYKNDGCELYNTPKIINGEINYPNWK